MLSNIPTARSRPYQYDYAVDPATGVVSIQYHNIVGSQNSSSKFSVQWPKAKLNTARRSLTSTVASVTKKNMVLYLLMLFAHHKQ